MPEIVWIVSFVFSFLLLLVTNIHFYTLQAPAFFPLSLAKIHPKHFKLLFPIYILSAAKLPKADDFNVFVALLCGFKLDKDALNNWLG